MNTNALSFLGGFLRLSAWQTLAVIAVLFGCFFILHRLKRLDFSLRMLVGLGFGVIFGIALQFFANFPSDNPPVWFLEAQSWFGFFGSVFIAFIKMLVLPIVFISILKVIIDIDKNVKISRLFFQSIFWLLFTTGIAASIAIILSVIFDLGSTIEASQNVSKIREVRAFQDILLNLLPSNIIAAMSTNNIIALVIFSFFISFGAKSLGSTPAMRPHYEIFQSVVIASYNIIFRITNFVIGFMPYAVVAMMAEVILENGFGALKSAASFIGILYACFGLMFLVYAAILLANGLSPIPFFKKSARVWVFAFSSRSSVGTLPFTIDTLQNRLGVSSATANFTASIGSTVGLNGCAGYFPAMCAIFIAHAIGVPFDFSFAILVVIMAIIGSLGIAGIPGVATMAASIMISGIGLSEHFVLLGVILAIDPIIDMARTSSNVAGVMLSAVVSDSRLKTLDKKLYAA